MRHRPTLPAVALALLLGALAHAAPAGAQRLALAPQEVKLDQLLRDTQKSTLDKENVEIVWWIPPEYWIAALSQQPGVSAELRDEFVGMFSQFNIVATVRTGTGAQNFGSFVSQEDTLAHLVLTDPRGGAHLPLPADGLPAQLTATLDMVRPLLASVMGPLGSHLHFVVFPGRDAAGTRLVDPLDSGRLGVKTQVATYAFRLPLGSLLPPLHDPATGEAFPGDYQYNPYTGAPLQPAPRP